MATTTTTGASSSTSQSSSTGGCGDTMTDPNNCGSCEHVCAAPFDSCTQGHCGDDVADVVGGAGTSCVVLWGGDLYCWGGNWLGQLGDGGLAGTESCIAGGFSYPCRPTPAPVSGLSNVIQAAMAYQHACAVEQDGSVWCWGRNSENQLGHSNAGEMMCTDPGGGSAHACNPTPAKVALPGGVKAAQVVVGLYWSCARTDTGDVYCWGDNGYGVLGVPLSTTSTPVPQKVNGLPGPATSIATDHDSLDMACALTGGQIWCWGSSESGGTGHDPSLDPLCGSYHCNYVPQVIKTAANPLDSVVDFGVGRDSGCALRNDGTVWCWGTNHWGTLGVGTNDDNVHATATQVTTGLPASVSGLFVSGGSAMFVTDSAGAVTAWGRNNYGLLGTGTIGGMGCGGLCESSPKAIGLSGVARMSIGEGNAVALMKDGGVYVWGDNGLGTLGHAPGTAGDQTAVGGWVNPLPAPLPGLP